MFNKVLEDLRRKPVEKKIRPEIEDYFTSLDTKKRYFREVIAKLKVNLENEKSREPLFHCQDYQIHEKSYYKSGNGAEIINYPNLGSDKYFADNIFLRIGILEDLKKADDFLRINSEGELCLIVKSGYRPLHFQSICKKGVESQNRSENAKPAEELFSDPKIYSPHATGAAFDIEIWEIKQNSILQTKFSNREKTKGSFFIETFRNLDSKNEEIRKNRRLLCNLLATEAVLGKNHFIAHPSEYWHFGRNERLSAFFAEDEKHEIYYDIVHNF